MHQKEVKEINKLTEACKDYIAKVQRISNTPPSQDEMEGYIISQKPSLSPYELGIVHQRVGM